MFSHLRLDPLVLIRCLWRDAYARPLLWALTWGVGVPPVSLEASHGLSAPHESCWESSLSP